MKIEIDLNFKSKKWPKHVIFKLKNTFMLLVSEALKKIKAKRLCKTLSFSVFFISDAEIKKYYEKSKNKTKATNVLSFPMEDFSKTDLEKFYREYLYLGEIMFAFETIKKESVQQNKSFQDHLLHLFIHSFLHLLNYVHESKKEREQMENLEILLLKKIGVKNPYQ